MQCEFIKQNGERCGAFSTDKARLCFAHNPNRKQEHLKAVRKGGKSSIKRKQPLAERINLFDSRSILLLLEDTINRIRILNPNGSIDIKTANSIGFLTSKLVEVKRFIQEEQMDDNYKEIEEFRYWKRNQEKSDRIFESNPEGAIEELIRMQEELIEFNKRELKSQNKYNAKQTTAVQH